MLTVPSPRANCRSQSTLYGRWSSRLFPIAGVLIAGLFTTFAAAQALHGRVVGVTDGDTIAVQDSDRLTHKVRLSGIDAPESRQAFGKRSKESLSRLVFGKPVRVAWTKKDEDVEFDANSTGPRVLYYLANIMQPRRAYLGWKRRRFNIRKVDDAVVYNA